MSLDRHQDTIDSTDQVAVHPSPVGTGGHRDQLGIAQIVHDRGVPKPLSRQCPHRVHLVANAARRTWHKCFWPGTDS